MAYRDSTLKREHRKQWRTSNTLMFLVMVLSHGYLIIQR